MSIRRLKARGIGRLQLLAWLNELLQTDYTKIEHLADGIAYCQILDALHPGKVNLSQVHFHARSHAECEHNFRVLRKAFHACDVKKEIPIPKLVDGVFQEHFEFLHWIHDYAQKTYPDAVRKYNGFERRQQLLKQSLSPSSKLAWATTNMNLVPSYSTSSKLPHDGYIQLPTTEEMIDPEEVDDSTTGTELRVDGVVAESETTCVERKADDPPADPLLDLVKCSQAYTMKAIQALDQLERLMPIALEDPGDTKTQSRRKDAGRSKSQRNQSAESQAKPPAGSGTPLLTPLLSDLIDALSEELSGRAADMLGLAFVLGAAAVLAAQRVAKDKCPKAKRTAKEEASTARGTAEMEDELLAEQLSRIRTFFGDEGYQHIKDAFVIVVGVGGVGSHAAHMLARSGVGRMRLIDFDNVTLSSLNRHAVATRADVGTPKVTALKKHLLETVPHCEIEDVAMMFEADSADELLAGNPTYVLDCIDDVKTKVALLAAVTKKGLKVITSMGAGGKADPTRLQIGSMPDAVRDPLATKMRYFLKKRGVNTEAITTIYSSERTVAQLLPLDPEQVDKPHEFGSVEHFRLRVIPVLGTMPAIFGQAMAAYVLCDLAKRLFVPEGVGKLSRDQRNKLYHKIQEREMRRSGRKADQGSPDGEHGCPLELEKDELDFIYQEIWRGRSAVSGVRQGGHERLYLARWRPERPLRPDNVVFITTKELNKLDKEGVDGFPADVVAKIDKHLASFGDWTL
ncbi:hypothetical protein P43SY_008869 [Pythium insidiosum]|uniref:Calponin-homology (CH) domain-containing protein n=1 Tax=Pythium insidiosum TaxID=114742 RepID=A0AAD5QDP1_PYTIN|nr:hypothetical protein P43SY_008869 [Pythium insidiosum]